jgi:hypothetical protein
MGSVDTIGASNFFKIYYINVLKDTLRLEIYCKKNTFSGKRGLRRLN